MASSSKFSSQSPPQPPRPRPPPIPTPQSFSYDVFLNFRGADTRNFTGHLYDRLVEAGIHTFMDDSELRIGEVISQELMTAIEESRIYIVVFSENYASSRWCLDELVKILECCYERIGRVAIPVFYNVEPSQVRSQRFGSFAEAFQRHEARYVDQLDMVDRWRYALTQAANKSGFDLQRSALGSESRLISLIIDEVISQVKPKKLFVAVHPVGLDSRLNDLCSLLRLESDNVCLIGIWGMGGSGKTVLAKALYNEILQSFNSSCFLANVREVSQQSNGLVYLQEQLISELLMGKNVKVGNVDRGIRMLEERFCRKKVVIVLDDLDRSSQVNALAGRRNWFGPGSVIIITTRDQQLLNRVEVDKIYETKELNYEESSDLFSWHSFHERSPPAQYATLADEILLYSGGLALALEVIGSYLFGRTIQEWNSAFQKLKRIPRNEIQEILKISYDSLDDDEQEIFLDIALFFVGMDRDYVTEILNGCGFSAEIGICDLKDRCLLLPDNRKNELRMHDLLRDMGREIVRQQSPREPGMRSRLWIDKDVSDVLTRNTGTEAIEGVALASQIQEEVHLNTNGFARMRKLRLLQMANVNLNGSFEHLSEEIRWICWKDCSLEYPPSNLHLINLVALDMQHSKMRRVWQGIQFLGHLKILNLSHSEYLTSTPDFKTIPRLVTLVLEGCTSLVEIHPSIGCLVDLLYMNLKGCEKITDIPSEICSLRLLGYLNLNGCSNVKRLPENLGDIEYLRELYADETAIAQLPMSFVGHNNLTTLSLKGCNKISPHGLLRYTIFGVGALRRLNLRDCNLFDEDIPLNIGYLQALQELDLAGNSLRSLPSTFTWLTNLESLWLDDWTILQSLPQLPPNLEALLAKNLQNA